NSNYNLPNFVDKNSLVIACSYSGNTEETLDSLDEALAAKAQIFCISSGGKVVALAQEKKLDHVVIPGGLPPRAALGYSITQLSSLFEHLGFSNFNTKKEFTAALDILDKKGPQIIERAKKIAAEIHNKNVVIYSEAMYEAVAVRLRQQLNENAKVLCWHHALPEMNHNELVGWAGGSKEIAVMNFRNEDDHPRTKERFRISKEIMSKYTDSIIDIQSEGDTRIQRSLFLIHLGDWISCFLAELRGVDPIEVNVIDFLKGSLAKI
ncbi:MAG: bifunctional phosphoglucose/phosphomannose isomerase, partial [Luteibaculum sp.]